jgi:hypothetical protein
MDGTLKLPSLQESLIYGVFALLDLFHLAAFIAQTERVILPYFVNLIPAQFSHLCERTSLARHGNYAGVFRTYATRYFKIPATQRRTVL